MPRVLLCAATEFEIAPAIAALPRFGGRVEVLITGVGLMETAWNLAARLAQDRPEYLVQAGIAGTLDAAQPLSQTVLIRRDRLGDLGVLEGGSFRSTFELGFGNPNTAPWTEGWLVNNTPLLSLHPLPQCDAISVNEISTDPERIAHYSTAGARAESMEGAAFHYAALRSGLPFVQLRTFSNRAGVRDKAQWTIRQSIENLNQELITLLTKLDTL
jgi:futalosine hydrolase